MGSVHNLVIILKMFNGVGVLVEASAVSDSVEMGAVSDFVGASAVSGSVETGAVLDFVEAFGVFSPVVENGIPVFEQFPRAA